MDYDHMILGIGILMGMVVSVAIFFLFLPQTSDYAEFVCESHGLELIDYEIENQSFSKVECGNKKPELQYDNYKVFEK